MRDWKIISDDLDPVAKGRKSLRCRLNGRSVLVYSNEHSARQPLGDLKGVSAAAGGSVHVDAVLLDSKCLYALVKQNRSVRKMYRLRHGIKVHRIPMRRG